MRGTKIVDELKKFSEVLVEKQKELIMINDLIENCGNLSLVSGTWGHQQLYKKIFSELMKGADIQTKAVDDVYQMLM